MNQDNVGRPPPPAVVGPPPRPNASTYLSLLPTSERPRTDTVSLQQEFHAQLNTLKPKPPPRVPVRHRRSAEGIPEQNNSKQPFVRTFSDLTVPKQTNFSVHQPSAAEIYSDFSVWRAACPPKIYMAVEFIAKHGLQVEGIFRISGDHNKINKLIENARILPADELYKDLQPNDVYVVADFLLRWFAEAFGSLIPEHIFKLLMQNAADMNEIPRKEVKGLIFSLGPSELSALFAVLQLCQLIMEVAVTKMTPRALATCIAPNLLFNPFETDIQVLRADSAKCNSIMEFLIEEFPHLLQDMNTGKSEKLIAFVREKYGNIVVEVSPVGSGDERGRSTEDDRGKKRIFKRKSRSRSRGKRSELKDGKK